MRPRWDIALRAVAHPKRDTGGKPNRSTCSRDNREQEFHAVEFKRIRYRQPRAANGDNDQAENCSPSLRVSFTVPRSAAIQVAYGRGVGCLVFWLESAGDHA